MARRACHVYAKPHHEANPNRSVSARDCIKGLFRDYGSFMRRLAPRRQDKHVMMTGEHIAEHFGRPVRAGSSCRTVHERSLSLNVVYTNPEATASALQAAESLARDLQATIHVRATVPVPSRISIATPLVSTPFLSQLLQDIVKRVGSAACQYVLHIYVCRNRIETLLRVLRPSSLIVIGGRRRIWPTAETRLSKAVAAAGHSVAFVDLKACRMEAR